MHKPKLLTTLVAISIAIATIACALLAPEGTSRADAQGRLRATLYVTQAAIPRGLTEKALIGFARGHQARTMAETQEPDLTQRHWLGNLIISFNRAPGDLEFHALYYDVTDGARQFVSDMAIFVHDREQRTYVQRLNLARPTFRPNRRLQMVVTVSHAEVGTVNFELRGEEPRRSGQVDFSEEDTRVRD